MKLHRVLGLSTCVSLLVLTAWVVRPTSVREAEAPPPTIVDPHALTAFFAHELSRAEAGSPQALEYARLIQKVKMKAAQTARPENPGALIEAFAQLKSDRDGHGYAPSYRIEAVKQVRNKGLFAKKRANWTEVGPGNVSGRIRTVVVDPDDPNKDTWFVASIGGGVWKTSDGGASWRHLTPDLGTLCITTLVQAPSNPDILYAGTGMGYGRVVDLIGSGIWKSMDRGESWQQLASTANGQLYQAINRIVVDPNNAQVLLACSNDGFSHLGPKGGERRSGIFRSSDGGLTWTQTFDAESFFGSTTDNRVQQIVADPSNFNRLYATVNEVGVIRSTDGGLTWSVSADHFADPADVGVPSGNGFGLAGISVRTEMAVAPSDPNRLYAAVERPRGIADLYMSRDGGDSWVLVNDTGNDPNWFNSFGGSGATGNYTAGWFDNCIAVHPTNPDRVFVGGVNIYRLDVNADAATRTSTLSTYWLPNNFGVPPVHADHHWLEIFPLASAPAGIRILNGNDGGVALSDDGGVTWTEFRGMRTSQFYGAAKKPGENVYIAGAQDNGTWVSPADPDINAIWTPVIGGDGFEAVWHARDPNLVLGNSQNNGIARSENGGRTFTPARPTGAGFGPFITKIAYSNTDPDLVFAVSSNGISRSDDFGKTWTLTPISGNWLGYRPFDNVEISEADPQIVWISSRMDIDPPAGRQGGIHVSSDGGLTFTEISANLPADLTEASGIAPDPVDAATCYLLFSAPGRAKIMRTNDLGQTWVDLSGYAAGVDNGFPDVAVFDLQVMPFDRNILWAATEIGLFVSNDNGASWAFDPSLPHVAIFELKIQEEQILAATQGRGIWTATVPEMANYDYPQVTLSPRLAVLALDARGNLKVDFDARSGYDSVQLLINGEPQQSYAANSEPFSGTVLFPQIADTLVNAQVVATKDGREYRSPVKQLNVKARTPVSTYSNNFDAATNGNDFVFNGFSLATINGLSNQVLASAIPYPNNSELTATLATPLLIPAENAIMRFEEFALVEPGSGSGVWGDPQFWDYVIVEGSTDGLSWTPLGDGYDARQHADWLAAFNSTGGSIVPSLFKTREFNLLDTFQAGDQILVRFRLSSDPGVNGFGWVIDNLVFFPENDTIQLGNDTVFPWVSQNEVFESILVVNNPSDQSVRYQLTALREGGAGERSAVATLPPLGFLATTPAALFPSIGNGSGLSIRLSADSAALRGRWVTNNLSAATGASPSQGVGIDMTAALAGNSEQAGTKIIFNYLPQSAGMTAAPVIVNVGDTAADVTLSFYTADGNLLLRDTTSLAGLQPNRPFARIVGDLADSNGADVMLVAQSDGPPITGVTFVFNEQGETAIGNAAAVVDAGNTTTDLLYAWISNSADFESVLVANNTATTAAEVTLTARRADGSQESTTRTVAAGGFLAEQASSLFPDMGAGAGYSVSLSASSGGLYGAWVTNNLKAASGLSPAQGIAVRVPSASQSAQQRVGEAILFGYLPGSNGFFSAPVIVNLHDQALDVDLRFYNRSGTLVFQQTLTALAPRQPFAVVAQQLIPSLAEDVQLSARSSGGPITGVAFVFNSGNEPAIGNVNVIE